MSRTRAPAGRSSATVPTCRTRTSGAGPVVGVGAAACAGDGSDDAPQPARAVIVRGKAARPASSRGPVLDVRMLNLPVGPYVTWCRPSVDSSDALRLERMA